MLTAQAVFEKVSEIFTDTDDSLLPFCEQAAAVVKAKMRAGVDASDIRLLTAAAAIALDAYFAVQNISDGDISSFKAGDVTVTKGHTSAKESAENFRENALAQAAELLVDSQFVFGTV